MNERHDPTESPLRVLIAGGGIAALEALLALRKLAGDRVTPLLFAPDNQFRYRPLSVTEPFGLGGGRDLDLEEIALEHQATFMQDGLVAVDAGERQVRTTTGRALEYDALLIAIGARGSRTIRGALAFRDSADRQAFRQVIDEVERGDVRHLAFAVPTDNAWPLGLYELALLTRAHLREAGIEGVELSVVSPEGHPMEVFGRRASDALRVLLDEAGVSLRLASRALAFEDGELLIDGGQPMACDRVVSLPLPHAPPLEGVPQAEPEGFIPVDRFCAVLDLERVWAAGDATWFPVKQGGLAAQQADSAASAIAELAGAETRAQPFRPVLRGALLTEWGPRYMRAAMGVAGEEPAAKSVLWWPPAKVAGKFLAPYLAAKAGYRPQDVPLTDLEATVDEDASEASTDHDDVLAVALASADQHAASQDFRGALRWLEVAEDLELYLPTEYEHKRMSWSARAG
jgi:sulfide:quinone oxidoreductase